MLNMDDDGHVLYIAEMSSCTHTHGHTHGFSFVFCFRLSACMQTYVHTYMHTDMHTYLHACPHRYVRTLWRWLVYIVTSSTLCSSKLGVRRGGCPNIFCQCFWGLLEGFGRRPMEHALRQCQRAQYSLVAGLGACLILIKPAMPFT